MNERNALAKLAERLTRKAEFGSYYCVADPRDYDKARRIVAELAKVRFNERGQPTDEWIACEAVDRCRAIAAERRQ